MATTVQRIQHPDVVLPFDEYHQLVLDLQRAMKLHTLLRLAAPFVYGVDVDESEREHVAMELDHFFRDYPVA
jgi:hypothetical protein